MPHSTGCTPLLKRNIPGAPPIRLDRNANDRIVKPGGAPIFHGKSNKIKYIMEFSERLAALLLRILILG